MVALPILAWLAWQFCTHSADQIRQEFAVSAYLFLCSIFVAMTNQVRVRSRIYLCSNFSELVCASSVQHI